MIDDIFWAVAHSRLQAEANLLRQKVGTECPIKVEYERHYETMKDLVAVEVDTPSGIARFIEDADDFPSEYLIAQLVLVAG